MWKTRLETSTAGSHCAVNVKQALNIHSLPQNSICTKKFDQLLLLSVIFYQDIE